MLMGQGKSAAGQAKCSALFWKPRFIRHFYILSIKPSPSNECIQRSKLL
jgi:hypothetical protein